MSKPEPVLPKSVMRALYEERSYIGPEEQEREKRRRRTCRAIAAAIMRAEAQGLEHRRSFGGDLFHERAAKLRAEADALEKEPADGA